ncbi:hypothetical protein NHX12_024600 [Muraenolepis orangiensis]|uniref:Uncharacterized protein n=1 Tax=Muraenolepis orangiensis TaxID=630683 RepID=A0A9Q0EHU4_9TELE|nr:hypothetical protein NHX12_024600 [Muraenolepis orangiensis]
MTEDLQHNYYYSVSTEHRGGVGISPREHGPVFSKTELCLRTLCDHGVDINATLDHSSRHTALHLAVRYKVPPAVPILASYGADVNAESSCGMTPLHMASASLRKDMVSSLIRLGADVNAIIPLTGNTPLHMATTAAAVQPDKGPETSGVGCISELLEGGADPGVANRAGRTPLQEACCFGEEGLVDALLSHGGTADIDRGTEASEGCLFLFLDGCPANVWRAGGLLSKLLCLSSPPRLAARDRLGRPPAALAGPRHAAQRERLLALSQQPRSLRDLCKRSVYLSHGRGRREALRDILPHAIFDFVFDRWDAPGGVSFDDAAASVCQS